MNHKDQFVPPPRTWAAKFSDAFSGLYLGIAGQSSFAVHFLFTFLVVFCGVIFQVSLIEWSILALTVGMVFSFELANSAFEKLAKATTDQQDSNVDHCLKIASGAVLVSAFAAVVVGCCIFGPKMVELFVRSS